MIYLDWAATAVPDAPLLAKAFEEGIGAFGNPSSPHAVGARAKALLSSAREMLLSALFPGIPSALRGLVAFTGSGTEADQIPFLSLLRPRQDSRRQTAKPHILVSAIEHAAIHEQALVLKSLGWELDWLRPDPDGRIAPSTLASTLKPDTKLVAIMALNNETGAIQDIEALSSVLKAAEGSVFPRGKRPHFHVDCVQGLGKLNVGFLRTCADSAAFSAHKLGGPKGTGALWLAKPLEVLAPGGGQEGGMRGGTENLAGAIAFSLCATKAEERRESDHVRASQLERRLLSGLASIRNALPLPLSRVAGDARWCPNIVSIAFPGLGGEVMVRAMSDIGIFISTGSACSHSGRKAKGRRVLEAMGVPEELSFSAVRVSTGPDTKPEEIDVFLQAASDIYRRLA
ncbi:MAG TPA: aminotransferase class V-fold PLP-dependent enzyme [Rectinemataceae bacterium]